MQKNSKLEKLIKNGLIGCLNSTDITSKNYKKKLMEISADVELWTYAMKYWLECPVHGKRNPQDVMIIKRANMLLDFLNKRSPVD